MKTSAENGSSIPGIKTDNQAFRFMVGPGHCPMISTYGPSLSKAAGPVDPSFLVMKLEDLKVLRRSPDLLNNVKIGQGQLQLIMEQILFYHIWGL